MLLTKTGWRVVRVTDLKMAGDEPGTCDKCGRQDLRFLHTVANLSGQQATVGAECARNLCFGYDPEREEKRLRNLWARRSRWLTKRWGTSTNGNATLRFKHGASSVRVTVFRQEFGGWKFAIAVGGNDPVYGSGETAEDAKLRAFDTVAAMLGWSSASNG